MSAKGIRAFQMYLAILLAGLAAGGVSQAQSKRLTLDDWHDAIVAPTQDPGVARAHRLFAQLLQLWNGPRLPPNLYVINDPAIWAESLPGGVILISRGAVALALEGKEQHGDAQLAFALAHEIAHQRADHLWQHGFFSRAKADRIPADVLPPSTPAPQEREIMEQQADAEGLTLAVLAGFDPIAMTGEQDFFTTWVERVRLTPCLVPDTLITATDPCAQAQRRAQQAREQLRQIATQTVFFELGIQAYAAGAYELARYYYEAFGRIAPSAAVHTNIGLTHLAQALTLGRASPGEPSNNYAFHYPIMLAETAIPSPKRGKSSPLATERRARLDAHLDAARTAFERAAQFSQIEPQYESHLIITYLVQGNLAMARGLLDGKLEPKFGNTSNTQLLRGLTLALEGRVSQARDEFLAARNSALATTVSPQPEQDLIAYVASADLERLYHQQGDHQAATMVWQSLLDAAQHKGREFLIHVAAEALNIEPRLEGSSPLMRAPRGLAVHQSAVERLRRDPSVQQTRLLANQQRLTLLRFNDGTRAIIDTYQDVLASWQDFEEQATPISSIQHALMLFGPPDRQVITEAGRYWAYDRAQWGLRWVDNRVAGVFQYPSEQLITRAPQTLRAASSETNP